MSRDQWTAVENYLDGHLVPADDVLAAALAASAAAGLPPIQVSPAQGRLLRIIASIHGARHILEIGTLAGYSTICLARGMAPGGRVVTLEIEPERADIARANFVRAGLADAIDLRLGPALDTLPTLDGPFDLVFIDADRPHCPDYVTWALRLSRPGTVLVIDNVVRDGRVLEATSGDAEIDGVRRAVELIGAAPRLTATAIQTVGGKGYDGLLVATVS